MQQESYTLMDGKVHIYKRENSRFWQCSTYMNGCNHRSSTKEETLTFAKDYAQQWYMAMYLRSQQTKQTGRISDILKNFGIRDAFASLPNDREASVAKKKMGPTFREATDKFLHEYLIITKGQRSEKYVKGQELRIRAHLLPYFGEMPVADITAGVVQEYRVHRQTHGHKGVIPSRASLHAETVALRLILKTAHRYQWIDSVPDISPPYKTSGKIKHRAWFSPDEYKMLYNASREKTQKNSRYQPAWVDFHDYILFMANTGLRPDEAARLEYRDVTIVTDEDSGERLLEIEVRGKRGVGYCKSMTGAILPFQRMEDRHNPKPTDKIFGKTPRGLMNIILGELNLKKDRDGNPRTAYSLRHTYICLRLMEGADIYQIAKNCRTSVEMIEKFYAAHLKNTLDASAINVRKPKKKAKKAPK
ncbi:MAG: site-specific integrase [Alphaproteobacteria bacterium]|nr:site-specific integrase [Alphaproteobacteria bacterium]